MIMEKKLKVGDSETHRLREKYPCIVQWGKELLSFDYYIDNQCLEAEQDDAPRDAVYKSGEKWKTVSELGNEETRKRFMAILQEKK